MSYVGFVFMLGIIVGSALIMTPTYGGKAETETQKQTIPIEGEILRGECPGAEDVEYSGTIRSIIHVTTDATGGFHLKTQLNLNLEGIGQTTGDEYHMTSNIGSKEFVSNDGSPITATFPATLHIRDGIDEKGKLLITLTINANGDPTVEKLILKVDCD